MVMKELQFMTKTTSGEIREIVFPLNPETRSIDDVSKLTSEILSCISNEVESHGNISDGDVLQALTMVCAIRAGMINVNHELIKELLYELLSNSLEAVRVSKVYQSYST